MAKLFLRDVGSHPERDLEVTLFSDGELQFESNGGKYVHINITREGVKELVDFLQKEIHSTQLVVEKAYCEHEWSYPPKFCPVCNKRVPVMRLDTKA